jgi:hypothetical protein
MNNRIYIHFGAVILAIGLATALQINGQQKPKADGSMTQESMDEMNKRGDKVMGFDHMKTTHHFILASDGGVIQVESNDRNDKESGDQIRPHLRHIATMFSDGNFEAPMLVHAQDPPGVEVMRQLKADITYRFEETKRGGRVRITSKNAEAIKAIHKFLIFQIKEHETGDALDVAK